MKQDYPKIFSFRVANRFLRFVIMTSALFLVIACASTQKDELGPELRNLLGIDESPSEPPKEDLERTFDANTLIRQAENHYAKEEYETALVEYQRYLDLHPIDRLANLARFRIGLCYYHQIRTIDRDVEPMLKALTAFQNLVKESPQSLYAQKTEPYIAELKSRLSEREYYIGYFYYKKGSYPAAIARLESLLKEYPDSGKAEDALFYLGASYQKSGNSEKYKSLFGELIQKNPKTRYREQINRILADSSPLS
ncbi:MAG: outer membrane protein assembly factor BamD [Nitrospirae bacterium]|nr:outer membrane protein assembly factor BamD [Nitrospirota bacterium]